eukprot:TRINITY_DN4157_c0_g1_i6.p1 TRINITY_DN4157_c0_g1~~TRINITY_DN4157_c0_g1_i6.p1  ORF type:complete len:356 (-),score=54.69 TRINITY_DN4157_c0_g1_i6:28-1056(-)
MNFERKEGEQKTREKPIPWVEKYRPKKLDDVSHQDEVVRVLRRCLETANLPHLLFYGPPGTGKTSTILAICRELYGPELMKSRVMELNASDERGIAVVREKIKSFAQVAVSSTKVGGYPCPPYKIIILDEADSMTQAAQSALRRTMETYSKVTRFCLICNYVTRIIDPLTSRCAKFRFKPLPGPSIHQRLEEIAQHENIRLTEGSVDKLIEVSGGDLRKVITYLQSAHRLKQGEEEGVTPQDVVEVACVVSVSEVERLLSAVRSRSFSQIESVARDMILAGYSVGAILEQLNQLVINDDTLSSTEKARMCLRMAEADKKLCDGADELLQLMDVLSYSISSLS